MSQSAATIEAALRRVAGRPCAACAGRCLAREAVWSIALGFKDTPRCLPCLSRGLERDHTELRAQLDDYVRRRECYASVWAEAQRLDATDLALPAVEEIAYDAGSIGCGELALALRVKLLPLPPGSVVVVTATDPAAPEDVPAWCRLTGHTLVSALPPTYRIRRKGV